MFDLVGRGARMRETTTRERGSRRCAPVSPSLLRFSLAHVSQAKLRSLPKANVRSLSLSLSLSNARHCRCLFFWGGAVVLNAFAVRARLLMLPMCFFTILYSLCLMGVVTFEKPPRGVYCECWVSHAAALRRETAAGSAPRPPAAFQKYLLFPPLCAIIKKYVLKQ